MSHSLTPTITDTKGIDFIDGDYCLSLLSMEEVYREVPGFGSALIASDGAVQTERRYCFVRSCRHA